MQFDQGSLSMQKYQGLSFLGPAPAQLLGFLMLDHGMEETILSTRCKGVVLLFLFLFLEEVLGCEHINAFTRVSDFESPFDVVFVEAELVYHSVHGEIDWVLDLRSE